MIAITTNTVQLLGTSISVTTMASTCARIMSLVQERKSAYMCFATAHMLVEAQRHPEIREAYRAADMVNPDGVPLAWCLKLNGFGTAECVSGPRLFPALLREAANNGIYVGFYGGREETLERIRLRINRELRDLKVSYMHSPPFRRLTEKERETDLKQIIESGTEILFVGLGSPKQECWMWQCSGRMPCVSLGIGAAFEFFSGEKILPPLWIQNLGLTWLVRLCQEPRRLIGRNLASPIFVALFVKEFVASVIEKWVGLGAYKSSKELCKDKANHRGSHQGRIVEVKQDSERELDRVEISL